MLRAELMSLTGQHTLRDLSGKPLNQQLGQGTGVHTQPDRSFQDQLKSQREDRLAAMRAERSQRSGSVKPTLSASGVATSGPPRSTSSTNSSGTGTDSQTAAPQRRTATLAAAAAAEEEPADADALLGLTLIPPDLPEPPLPVPQGERLESPSSAAESAVAAPSDEEASNPGTSQNAPWKWPASLEKQLAGGRAGASKATGASQKVGGTEAEDSAAGQALTPPQGMLQAWRKKPDGPGISQVPDEFSGVMQVDGELDLSKLAANGNLTEAADESATEKTKDPKTRELAAKLVQAKLLPSETSDEVASDAVQPPPSYAAAGQHAADPYAAVTGTSSNSEGRSGGRPAAAQPAVLSGVSASPPEFTATVSERSSERSSPSAVAGGAVAPALADGIESSEFATRERLSHVEIETGLRTTSTNEPAAKPASSGVPLALNQTDVSARLAGYLRSAAEMDQTLKIRLTPPELGTLQIEVKQRDGQTVARLEVETELVKSLLLEQMPQLREALQQQGLKLDQVEVEINDQLASDQDQAGSQPEREGSAGRDQAEDDGSASSSSIAAPHFRRNRAESLEEIDIQV